MEKMTVGKQDQQVNGSNPVDGIAPVSPLTKKENMGLNHEGVILDILSSVAFEALNMCEG